MAADAGAITNAYVEWEVGAFNEYADAFAGNTLPLTITIYGVKEAAPAALNRDITGAHALSQSATKTSTSVSWQVPTSLTTGQKIQTPDLSPIVNEILSLPDPKYSSRGFGFIFESPATTEVQWTCKMNSETNLLGPMIHDPHRVIRPACDDGTIVDILAANLLSSIMAQAAAPVHTVATTFSLGGSVED